MRLAWVRIWALGVMGLVAAVPGLGAQAGLESGTQTDARTGTQTDMQTDMHSGADIATVQVEYTNPGLTPSHWVMKMHADGSAQFDSDGVAAVVPGPRQIEAGDVHRPIQLSHGFMEQVFATARDRKLFAFPCDSHMKVAFQGTKRLSYSGPEGSGACAFNYSKDKQIEALATSLVAVELTILSGARMEKLLQHDKLGLDAELESLVTAAHDGNALELGTISETLTRIATDDQVLDRARKKARLLLTQVR